MLIPDLRAGCSLAASITGADVRALREAYPGVPVVTYVNTSAEVKAEADICCTSANAVRVVESLGAKRVILIPDEYLAKWVATQTSVEIITWKGHCEVHERFTGEELRAYRESDPGVKIIAHPGMRARRAQGGGFHRLDLGHDQMGQRPPAVEGAARDGMLDERQCRGRGAERRLRAAVQSLPAYEADHAAEDPREPRVPQGGGHDRSRDRRARARLRRAHDQPQPLTFGREANFDDMHVQFPAKAHEGIVVVGAGLAGLFTALKLAPLPVTVISAARFGEGASSLWAQGGIAAALAEGDTAEAHAADTIGAGAGIVDEKIALLMAREARGRIEDLLWLRRAVRQRPCRTSRGRPRGRAWQEPHSPRQRRHGGTRHHACADRGRQANAVDHRAGRSCGTRSGA